MLANLRGETIPVVRLDLPGPRLLHVRGGNGLNPLHDVRHAELVLASPGRVQVIAHVAQFMLPYLKRANSVNHKGAQHVVAIELLVEEHRQDVVNDPELIRLGWSVLEVRLGHG